MQVVYHIGAHVTDEDRLLKCLLKNTERLRSHATVIPGPGRYRRTMSEILTALGSATPGDEAREALLDSIVDVDDVTRLILSFDSFICGPRRVFQNGFFYPRIGTRAVELSGLLKAGQLEFHMATRNPATFIPALMARAETQDVATFLDGADPKRILWSDVIGRLRAACPSARIVVWCNEDTPLIWGDILHSLAGTTPDSEELAGSYDLLSELMTTEGFTRFRTYMASHPITSPTQRRRVIEAFLDKFARPEMIEEEIDFAGWSETEVEEITARYEEDMDEVSRMSGVEMLLP